MISLRAANLSHCYQGRLVLQEVNLEIGAGESFAIVGHNGAGKSTLLRLLAFLERPSAGEVVAFANGAPTPADLALRRRVVMVMQRPFLFNTSVLANVAYGPRVRGASRREARERAHRALDMVGISALAEQPARTLSGGEAQLVNLARALAVEPEVLLLDEVTSHLDPDNEARAEEVVTNLTASGRVTVIVVTQDVDQAARLAARGALLSRGRVVAVGPVPEVFAPRR